MKLDTGTWRILSNKPLVIQLAQKLVLKASRGC
jgi:hypothetical protein